MLISSGRTATRVVTVTPFDAEGEVTGELAHEFGELALSGSLEVVRGESGAPLNATLTITGRSPSGLTHQVSYGEPFGIDATGESSEDGRRIGDLPAEFVNQVLDATEEDLSGLY